ncbi:MAG: hypothetical protein LBI48_07980 [Burkholderiaceae bacterium]|nr:hypothetical protein [Burkholderiaceae bacterium]
MRVNARFEGEAEQQLSYLAEVTGTGVSEVLRASVQHYYDQMRAQRGGLVHFAAFVGRNRSGRDNVASNYKSLLTKDWGAKHQGKHVYAVHEPSPPWLAPPPAKTPRTALKENRA